jgi:hypothetical protein
MTASELFFKAANNEHLPAAVPIASLGIDGVATVVFFVDEQTGAKLALSSSGRDRAIAAIFACRAARDEVSAMIAVT